MATKKNKNLNYYLKLPWSYTINTTYEDGNPLFIVRVNELPGVCTDAPTIEAAMKLIMEAIKSTIKLYIEQGEEAPEPIDQEAFKGNIAYRTTNQRHYRIAREATLQKKSLSTVIDECIDKSLR